MVLGVGENGVGVDGGGGVGDGGEGGGEGVVFGSSSVQILHACLSQIPILRQTAKTDRLSLLLRTKNLQTEIKRQ